MRMKGAWTYVYGYDSAGRLDTVTIDGVLAADYDHDDNGNRLLKTTPGGSEAGDASLSPWKLAEWRNAPGDQLMMLLLHAA